MNVFINHLSYPIMTSHIFSKSLLYVLYAIYQHKKAKTHKYKQQVKFVTDIFQKRLHKIFLHVIIS